MAPGLPSLPFVTEMIETQLVSGTETVDTLSLLTGSEGETQPDKNQAGVHLVQLTVISLVVTELTRHLFTSHLDD